MDRLSALIVIAALGCDKDAPPAPPSRVEGAKTGVAKTANTEAFCDVHTPNDSGPTLVFPALNAAPPAAAGHWRWVNIWATWCKPCVEEMPRLVKWRGKLAAAGRPVDLAFVSVDESDADIATFRQAHADAPASLRLTDPKKQGDWFKQLGLDDGSPIPIHIFASPSGHIRCARAGGLRDQDYAAIERLLTE